ncbi:hypothetical protein A0J61_08842 [Choanephora cucurbitarum]|uniref:Shugoshin C-terminal domain-containing protein n=1 Tax=Choanephora cucurbitarum TaxID=101091 RepID=A0A1C7N250_9FUNG|nr:hypothetical protein A0J61_08842 [Choanephora cucurbitarum]
MPGLLAKYQEQNAEIIRNNIKLNERIAILESVISQLQQENLQLRMENIRKNRKKKYAALMHPKAPKSKSNLKSKTKDTPVIPTSSEQPVVLSQKRSCTTKPISYVLPSTKSKLRKGDPFTFGNDN